MDAIIFADRTGSELKPLNQNVCPALIPLLGKTLVEHAIEHCQKVGVTRIFLIIDPMAREIKALLGRGEKFGVDIQYSLSVVGQSPLDSYNSLKTEFNFPILCMRGDIIYHNWITPELTICASPEKAGMQLLIDDALSPALGQLDWWKMALLEQEQKVEYDPLQSLGSLYQAQMSALGNLEKLPCDSAESLSKQLVRGLNSRVDITSLGIGKFFLSDHSLIAKRAFLQGKCSIGRNVVADKHSEIIDSVVFDGTYIGSGTKIENALVCQNWIYRADLDQILFIDDPCIISPIKRPDAPMFLERIASLLLFIAFLPVLLITWLGCFIWGKNCWKKVEFFTNQRIATNDSLENTKRSGFVVDTNVRWLKRLLLLPNVLSGHLKLFGRSPFHKAQSSPWRDRYEKIPHGVFSRAQVRKIKISDPHLYEFYELEAYFND